MRSTTDTINILCSIDDNYVPYCGIMLTSLFETNPESNLHIYIIFQNLSEENQSNLFSLANQYGNLIDFVKINEEDVKDFPIRKQDHVSLATYYRLFAPVILPAEIDRILYLDCDMIVNGSLNDLYKIDLDNYALACVLDEDYMNDAKYRRLGLSGPKTYFNAGMLLINLDYWRKHNVYERCIDCIAVIPEKLLLHDQDTLNIVLQNEVLHVSVRYNMQTGLLHIKRKLSEDVRKDILECVNKPTIIHYTGPRKPWLKHYHHPYIEHFRYYMKKSPWKNLRLTVIPKEERRYYRHAIKFFLHLKKYPYIVKRIKVSDIVMRTY